ncbi:MAG: hypothetical protein M1457_09305, partial [bacterium]|nr:hypothetical protein [bacterium]
MPFRPPLVVIRGALSLIDPRQARDTAADTLQQAHTLLLKNCQRLSDVVDTILDVTEIENGTLQLTVIEVNLHALIENILKCHHEAAA